MFCRKCGTRLPEDSRFCYKCGAKIDNYNYNYESNQNKTNEIVNGLICPNCGNAIYLSNGYYVCLSKGCGYRYKVETNNNDKTHKINIDYNGKYGKILKKNIKISNEGININNKFLSIDRITGFQFKIVKNSMGFYQHYKAPWQPDILFSVPMGTDYEATVTVDGEYGFSNTGDKTFLDFKSEDYKGFVENVWQLLAYRITVAVLKRLQRGEEIKIDEYAYLNDHGIRIIKLNLFSKNEERFYSWEMARKVMRIKHEDGGLNVEFTDCNHMGGYLMIHMGFISNDNSNIFERLLTIVLSSNLKNLSELL